MDKPLKCPNVPGDTGDELLEHRAFVAANMDSVPDFVKAVINDLWTEVCALQAKFMLDE